MSVPILNQSVENAGVAFVKGADKRIKLFEKTRAANCRKIRPSYPKL